MESGKLIIFKRKKSANLVGRLSSFQFFICIVFLPIKYPNGNIRKTDIFIFNLRG